MSIERALILVIAAGSIAWIVLLTQPVPAKPIACKGIIYTHTDGSQSCEPRAECPKGPR